MVNNNTAPLKNKRSYMSATTGEKVFDAFIYIILAVCFLLYLFPLLYVVLASVTPYKDVVKASLVIIPSEVTLEGYRFIFENSNMVQAFGNTAFVTIVGTILSMVVSILMAFPLSKKDLPGRGLSAGLRPALSAIKVPTSQMRKLRSAGPHLRLVCLGHRPWLSSE